MTLSIILRTNGERQDLEQTLDCLRNIKGVDYEVLVVEEGSAGDTLSQLRQREEPICYLALPAGTKVGGCLNAAMRLARGEYLVFLQAGTKLAPNWLPGAIQVLEKVPGCWCYTAAGLNGSDQVLPPRPWPNYKKAGRIFTDILSGGISPQSAVFPRGLLERAGEFDEELTALVEEEMLLRLSLIAPARYSSGVLVWVKPQSRTDLNALVTRCYWMSEFLPQLERAGMKKSALTALLEDIDDAEAWADIGEYLHILEEDEDYCACIQAYGDKKYPQREIQPVDTSNVSGVKDCVGCGSCAVSCPVDAISMKLNPDGFLYPNVDESRCTQCGQCLTVCPTQCQLPSVPVPTVCYAAQAEDSLRMSASSGGMFPLVARYVLDQGGYVAGAVYDKHFVVRHIVSNRQEDIQAMQGSKYVQSDTSAVYPRVRALLDEGKMVLFSGCVCQVAGLQAYLGKSYENLYTMDVICHGVPSVQVYQRYLKELQQQGGTLKEVNFRKKQVFGWHTNLYVRFSSGKAYAPKDIDLYMYGFLHNWFLRESCYSCAYKGMKYSDLTVADFWGIQQVIPDFEDGKGTSYLTVNTEKGEALFGAIEKEVKKLAICGPEQMELAHMHNTAALTSVERPAFRDLFFDQWRKDSSILNNAIARGFQSLCFDVGLILHWSLNFGNAMTNYALYTYLSRSRKVLAVDNCSTLRPRGVFRSFAKQHYICSSDYFPNDSIKMIERRCDTLMVGSDQVWNRYFNQQFKSGTYYLMDFAEDRTRKVAYGASFGTRGAEELPDKAELFRRFSKIGVREKFGVDSCKNLYGVEAEHVLDPVFLLEPSDYEELADQAKSVQTEPFLLAYILNPTEEKRRACQQICERLGGKLKVISICEPNETTIDLLRHTLDFAYIQPNATPEDFVYFFKNCQYVVTDSFHGTCFSIIFRKNFASFVNRQADRFTVFQQFGDAFSHIGTHWDETFFEACMKPLDYHRIQEDLKREQKHSQKWLEDALR